MVHLIQNRILVFIFSNLNFIVGVYAAEQAITIHGLYHHILFWLEVIAKCFFINILIENEISYLPIVRSDHGLFVAVCLYKLIYILKFILRHSHCTNLGVKELGEIQMQLNCLEPAVGKRTGPPTAS